MRRPPVAGSASLVLACALAVAVRGLAAAPTAAPKQPGPLGVSPLLVDAAAEAWTVIARESNPIWPGWSAATTPLLFYLPGRQDLLIGHPHPPEGFRPYAGPLAFPGASMWVKDGPTIIGGDGQNTSTDVAGVRTLVVADPLSNLRQRVAGWLLDPRPAVEKARTLELDKLAADPYEQLALIVHEAFHVYQARVAPDRGANEMLLLHYPVLSAENNAGFGLESEALADALRARDDTTLRAAVVRWLAVRQHRRRLLPLRAIQYEDGTEFGEGLAKYAEYRLWQVLEGRSPSPALERAQGFAGYRDLAWKRDELVRDMLLHMRGEANMNNDPYGTAPLRMRLYYSGMAIGALLDRLDAGWQHGFMTSDSSLTAFALQAVNARPEELASALAAARAGSTYATLLAAKTDLEAKGRQHVSARAATIMGGPGTGVVVDYSLLGSSKVGLAFTPFGIAVVDANRTIFDQVPISARFSDESEFAESIAYPVLRDTKRREIACRLEKPLARAEIVRLLGPGRLDRTEPGPVKLELPGLTLDLKNATLRWKSGTLRAILHPSVDSTGSAN